MRKIEQQMLEAIHARRNWKCGNTEVAATVFTHAKKPIDRVTIYLHGHPIAVVTPDTVTVSDCGRQTPTTKSRLNALLRNLCGAGVYQKDKKWYGYAIEETEWLIEKYSRHVFVRA